MSDKDQIEFLRSLIFQIQRKCRDNENPTRRLINFPETTTKDIDNLIEQYKEGPIFYKGKPVTPLPEWKTLKRC